MGHDVIVKQIFHLRNDTYKCGDTDEEEGFLVSWRPVTGTFR